MKKTTLLCLLFTLMAAGSFAQVAQVKENQAGVSRRLQQEIDDTKDPALGYVPKARLLEAYQSRKNNISRMNAQNRASLSTWIERGPYTDGVGPSNGNTRPGNGKTAGRVRAIWEDLGDATGKTVWVGGIDGGLWKTNDITSNPASWTCINDFFGNLSVASICQDPTDLNVLYFGTGEKAINADAVRGGGIWSSNDHGLTWSIMAGTSNFWNVSKVVCDASGNLYVGCNSISNTAGLQRFTKSTGTWSNITPSGLQARVPDIEMSSTGRLHVTCGYYNTAAASSGYRFTDNPATVTSTTWTSPTTTFPTQYNVDLASIGNTLYALPSNSVFEVPTIYKSTNGGVNWAATTATPAFTSGQSWYNMAIAIDPNNANNVIVGALDCYKTTNGGTSWTKISNWVGTTGQYVHADQQIICWRSNNQVLIGCDGGVHYSADGGTTISDRNVGLRIKQFYSVAIHPTSANYFLAGAQDNGVHQLSAAGLSSSVEVTGGDGAFVHIDQNQGQYQWGSYVYNQYRRSADGGATWSSINYSTTAGRFINPSDYDDASNIMYASGAANAFVRWSNAQTGSTFTSVTMSGLNSGTVSALKVSPYSTNTVFFAGGGSGIVPSIIKATAANATPVFTSIIGTGMTTASASISCIELGTNEQNIIAVYSNYGVNNVWVTANGGTSWTTIDGNLPDMPVRWAMFYPGDNTKAIIATETGIWKTDLINGTATIWDPETTFPNVRTDMLEYRASDATLAASTHGRGLFTTTLSANPTCGMVTGLATTGITTNSATIGWSALTGALNYDVDYKLNSSSTWTNAATATTSLSVALSGLTASSLYDFQIRANCTGATGSYSSAQFTSAAPPSCGNVTGLAASAITSASATINWAALTGALNYDVDYKLSTDANWTNRITATTSLSVALSGLSTSTLYDYRVRANCTGATGNYIAAQFSTTAIPTCGTVSGLASSAISATGATLSWTALSGALNYDVDYKLNTATTWTNAATAITTLTRSLTGLTASSLYDYRVRANCTGATGAYAAAQFTTAAPITCPGIYDVSTNGAYTGAASTPLNTAVFGTISSTTDVDYYKFVITTGGTANINLTTLPANYDLTLYSSNGTTSLATSRKTGTSSELIARTYTAGTYYIKVAAGTKNVFNASSCYTLNVQTVTASIQELPVLEAATVQVKIFPNPSKDNISVYLLGDNTQKKMTLYDISGKSVYTQQVNDMITNLDIHKLNKGVYIIKISGTNGKVLYSEKIIKN